MPRHSSSGSSLPLGLLVEFSAKYQGPPAEPGELERLEKILALARENETSPRSLAAHWSAGDPLRFLAALVHLLKQPRPEADVGRFQSLVTADVPLAALLEPACYSERDACELVRKLGPWVPNLDLQLIRRAFGDDADEPKPVSSPVVQRALAMLSVLSPGERILPFLGRACRIGDQRISSQVARLAGRYRARGLLVRLLEDSDPRVRANAVESLASAPHVADHRELLWRAARDEHHRVAVNALVGLVRLGEHQAIEHLEALAGHPAPAFRAAAAWGMGELSDLRFQPTLTRLYRNEVGAVRRNALRALVRLRKALAAEPPKVAG